jgi:anti-anti-sigma regulatory factor
MTLEFMMSITMTYVNLGRTRAAILRPAGALDRSNYGHLIVQALAAREDGARALIVDLRDVARVGEAGLVGLYAVARLAQVAQRLDPETGWSAIRVLAEDPPPVCRLAVVNPRPPVRQALARALFEELLAIHADVDAALAALAA